MSWLLGSCRAGGELELASSTHHNFNCQAKQEQKDSPEEIAQNTRPSAHNHSDSDANALLIRRAMALRNQLAATLLSFIVCLLGIGCTTSFAHAQDGDESVLSSEITRLNNQSLLWGPYRPNLYFGLRPRIPKSLMAGLMWAKVDNFQDVQHST